MPRTERAPSRPAQKALGGGSRRPKAASPLRLNRRFITCTRKINGGAARFVNYEFRRAERQPQAVPSAQNLGIPSHRPENVPPLSSLHGGRAACHGNALLGHGRHRLSSGRGRHSSDSRNRSRWTTDRRHLALASALSCRAGHGPQKLGNRRDGHRVKCPRKFLPDILERADRWHRCPRPPWRVQLGVRIRIARDRNGLGWIQTLRRLVPTKVGRAGASSDRKVDSTSLATDSQSSTDRGRGRKGDLTPRGDAPDGERMCTQSIPGFSMTIVTKGAEAWRHSLAENSRRLQRV